MFSPHPISSLISCSTFPFCPFLSCVLLLPAHRLSGVNHSISISPRGKSPLLLLTSSGINAGCLRRVGDAELPRLDSPVRGYRKKETNKSFTLGIYIQVIWCSVKKYTLGIRPALVGIWIFVGTEERKLRWKEQGWKHGKWVSRCDGMAERVK